MKMKQIAFTISLLLIFLNSFGKTNIDQNIDNKGVIFENLTLQEALNKAMQNKKEPKMVFVDCYTSWCGPCKYMSTNIFPKEVCGTFFNSNFINIKIDMEKGEGPEVAKKYSVSVYPTFLILDCKGQEINRVIGSDEAEPFINKVKMAMNPLSSPKARFEAYNKDSSDSNLYLYIKSLKEAYLIKELGLFIQNKFFSWTPEVRYSKEIWEALISPTGALSDTKNEIFKYILNNRFEIDKYIGKEKVDEQLLKTFKVYMMRYISGNLPDEKENDININIVCANAISNCDFGIETLVKMVRLKQENKIEDVVKMLSFTKLYRSNALDQEMIEKSVTYIKDLTPEQKTIVSKYYNDKSEYLTRDAAYAKRTAEKLVEVK